MGQAPLSNIHPLFAPIFSMAAAILIGLGIGSLHVPGSFLQPYAMAYLLVGILFYVWSAHLHAQARHAALSAELALIREQLAARRRQDQPL